MDIANIGLILIIIGIILLIIGSFGKGESKFAIGGFIGPIPFGFGNDPKLVLASIVIGAIMIILLLLFLIRP